MALITIKDDDFIKTLEKVLGIPENAYSWTLRVCEDNVVTVECEFRVVEGSTAELEKHEYVLMEKER